MDFNPPEIYNIDDVLPHIADKPEILVMKKEKYTVIDYVYQTDTTFDNPYARECRGLKFDLDGKIIARPYHKFKNLNEDEEYQEKNIDWTKPHDFLEKLDGSMVHSVWIDGEVQLHTRKGNSEVALRATEFLYIYKQDILEVLQKLTKFTCIFEYVGPNNKIVLDYKQEELVLTGIRSIDTGKYLSTESLIHLAKRNNMRLPAFLVRAYENLNDKLEFLKNSMSLEGAVIRFKSGAMVKVKADDYVLRHRSKDMVSNFCDLVKMLLDGTFDDIRPILDSETLAKTSVYADDFYRVLDQKGESFQLAFDMFHNHLSKKEMALKFESHGASTVGRFIFFKIKDAALKAQSEGKELNTREKRDIAVSMLSEKLKAAASSKVKLVEFCQQNEIPIYEGSFFDT